MRVSVLTREAPVTQSVIWVGSFLLDSAMFLVFRQPISPSTRYFDATPTSEVTLVTIRYIPPHHGHTSQNHGHDWMTHILFVPCQSAVPFLRQDYFRLWLRNSEVKVVDVVKGSKVIQSVIQSVQHPISLFSFHVTSIRPAIPKIQLFR